MAHEYQLFCLPGSIPSGSAFHRSIPSKHSGADRRVDLPGNSGCDRGAFGSGYSPVALIAAAVRAAAVDTG
jgi:hypothetical protein